MGELLRIKKIKILEIRSIKAELVSIHTCTSKYCTTCTRVDPLKKNTLRKGHYVKMGHYIKIGHYKGSRIGLPNTSNIHIF